MSTPDKINLVIYKKVFPFRQSGEEVDTTGSQWYYKNTEILQIAYNAFKSLENFRKEAQRCTMYTFGNQWGDYITVPSGKRMTEENYIKTQGKIPLKNNLIRGLVRTILGHFSATQTESICIARDRDEQQLGEMMSAILQTNYQRNKLWDLDRRALETFLISGIAVFKTTYGWKDGMDIVDVWTDNINHNRVFFDPYMEDPRHWDCSIIGEIHDLGLEDVLAQFSNGSREKAARLMDIYRNADKTTVCNHLENLCGKRFTNMDFFITEGEDRCRVIEIWRKESKERLRVHDTLTGEWYKVEIQEEEQLKAENARRTIEQAAMGVQPEDMKLVIYEWFVDRFWYYYFLSPYGDILNEGETPYYHKLHPYSFKVYPFFNSSVHSFVSDAIDQNRYINRLITMQDFLMGSAAKGVLMFPETCKPDSMSMEEIAEEWVAYNGIIYYKPQPGVAVPQQVIANTTQTGAYEMLALQMNLYKDTTGIYGALQGQQPAAGTPASLYSQQIQNSATNLIDVLDSFRQLREDRDTKIMKLQQQYYKDSRYINILGNSYSKTRIFNPEKVRNIDFDLTIKESVSTPSFRASQNELLIKLLEMGQINVEMMLENGYFPFADKLLQSIKTTKEQILQDQANLLGQNNGQLPPETQPQN